MEPKLGGGEERHYFHGSSLRKSQKVTLPCGPGGRDNTVALASDRRSSNLGSATCSEIVLLLPEI